MGKVYLAKDRRLDRKVALKFLPESTQKDPVTRRRFEREAKAAAAIDHPFICKVYETGQIKGQAFISMEYVEGESLKEKLKKGRLSFKEVITIALEVSDGLQKVHSQNIVHRDLKPSNILLTRDGHIKIVDFGLAKRIIQATGEQESSLTAALIADHSTFGTLAYMSPEQLKGEKVDHRADIFSFGTLLFEMVTGKHPFHGNTPAETAGAILRKEVVFSAKIKGEQWAQLKKLILAMLVKNPIHRIQSTKEIHKELKDLQKYVIPIHRRRIVGLTAAGLVVISFFLGVIWYLFIRTEPNPRLTNWIQLTSDKTKKTWQGNLASDGQVVYFTSGFRVRQTSGIIPGDPIPIPDPWPGEKRATSLMDFFNVTNEKLVLSAADGEFQNPFYFLNPLYIIRPPNVGKPVGIIRASSACWSPDGKQIAYADGEGQGIYIVDQDGSNSTKLVTNVTIEKEGRTNVWDWSPDNRISWGILYYRENRHELWQSLLDGTDSQQVRSDSSDQEACRGRWSPSGNYFLFISKAQIWGIRKQSGLWGKKISEPFLLSPKELRFSDYTFSPDGSKVFAVSYELKGELFRYHSGNWSLYNFAPESSATGLDFHTRNEGNEVWAAYVKYPEGTLWRSLTDGTQKKQLTEPQLLQVKFPKWSPDGEMIAFVVVNDAMASYGAKVVSKDGQVILHIKEGIWMDLDWIDGNRIAATLEDQQTGERNLKIIDLETGSINDLPGPQGLVGFATSPNSSYMAAHTFELGWPIWLLDLRTDEYLEKDKWTQLRVGGGMISWSTDSRHLYFSRRKESFGNAGVYRIHLKNEEETEAEEKVADFTNLPQEHWWWGLDPEGNILGHRSLSEEEIYVLEFEN
jgi:Tol biopolymer transport system component/predicted Ser/Thr protein kinase